MDAACSVTHVTELQRRCSNKLLHRSGWWMWGWGGGGCWVLEWDSHSHSLGDVELRTMRKMKAVSLFALLSWEPIIVFLFPRAWRRLAVWIKPVWFEAFPKVPNTTEVVNEPNLSGEACRGQPAIQGRMLQSLIYLLPGFTSDPVRAGVHARGLAPMLFQWETLLEVPGCGASAAIGVTWGQICLIGGGRSIAVIPSASVHSRRLHMQQRLQSQ